MERCGCRLQSWRSTSTRNVHRRLRAFLRPSFLGAAQLLPRFFDCSFVSTALEGFDPGAQSHARVVLDAIVEFAARNALSKEQTEAAVDTMRQVLEKDAAPAGRGHDASVEHLQALLLHHAVNRPPRSMGVFLPSEAVALYDFIVQLYYRHYKLFRHCLTGELELSLQQAVPGGTEEPPSIPPLSDAVMRAPATSTPTAR